MPHNTSPQEVNRTPDPRTVLGVKANAGASAIKEAFRRLARRVHPDVNPSAEAADQMQQLNAAYAALNQPSPDTTCTSKGTTNMNTESNRPNSLALTPNPATGTLYSNTAADTRYGAGELMRHGNAGTGMPGGMGEGSALPSIPLPSVSRSFQQLGIFVLDGSISMSGDITPGMTKADAVNGALRELFTRFHGSRHKGNFSFAAIAFDETATTMMPVTAAGAVDDNADYDPLAHRGGGTFIGSGLEQAEKVAQAFLQDAARDQPGLPASVVIIVMSDGECGNPDATRVIAERIKRSGGERITLCATHFAPVGKAHPDAQALLKQVATNPVKHYKTIYDAESLRKFFQESVSAGRNI